MTAVEHVLERLDRVKRSGSGWTARCPSHDDRNPSLSITEGDDGRVLVTCHAGCEPDAIMAALGLELAALFGDRSSSASSGGRRIVTAYDYVDERGKLLSQAVRFEPKGFAQRRPDGRDGWVWSLGETRRVLYRLPTVRAAAKRGDRVYVVEGEKDVHALEQLGLVATCNAMGAGKWRDEYAEQLRGAGLVAVVPDDDDAGRAHARIVAASLSRASISTKVVEIWPAGDTGRDAADWLAYSRNGDGSTEQARQLLEEIVERTPAWQASEASDEPRTLASEGLHVVTLDDFVAVDEPGADALIGDGDNVLIPENGDVMFYGDGGAGKTTLTIDAACHLAAGDDWLGVPVARPVRVLLVENEGPRPLFRAKLERKRDGWAGSPLCGRLEVLEQPWAKFSFADLACRRALAATVGEREVDVVVVGPVTRSGMNEAGTLQDVRDFMELVDDVRQRSGRRVAFVLIHHENKGGKVSGAWEAAGDTLFHVQAQGKGHTRLYVQKARWSSAHHQTTLQLVWTAGDGFALSDEPERDDVTIADEMLAAVRANGGATWNTVEKAVPGKRERKRTIRDRLLAGGRLIDIGGKGGMKLWHADDPARPATQEQLSPAGDSPGTHLESGPGETRGEATESLSPALRGTQDSGTHPVPPPPTSETAS